MSEVTDCKHSTDSASRKRCQSSDNDEVDSVPNKSTKVADTSNEKPSESWRNSEAEGAEACAREESGADVGEKVATENTTSANNSKTDAEAPSHSGRPPHELTPGDAEQTPEPERSSTPSLHQSDSAAIAAAEALASLTGGDGKAGTSGKPKHQNQSGKLKQRSKGGLKTQAAVADSSTSLHSSDREEEDEAPDEGDDSLCGSSSTPSSSFPSDNEENDDGECAIVSVKMAPEMRQSVALLAQVQTKLDALEKKSARLHQRLDLKIGRLRQPHLDQRSNITKTIPGFWVTALLNHPHLSAHIDETDEDALSYMTDLEVESVKNNKLGFRIRFHFRRNPYFQNNIIMKELHLGVGGQAMSFSNPILWHRGHNLTAHSEPRKLSRGVYETFFSWFGDHSNPGQDDVAQILKDDLHRDPLRYYLTPLWEPRENGSAAGGARTANNGSGDDCVVISDSDEEDPGEEEQKADGGQDDDDDEEDEEDRERSADESQEEDGMEEAEEDGEDGGEIVIDGSDDSDQDEKHQSEEEEREEEDVDTEN
ncbi:testis specific protein Y-linked [Synchiropus splendidus]|uniref:testis specific protein Y-linked n=1 Tax=Synchiropus splendidus TaxID=270530 RepID=UPI00237EB41A|nr:testis specific protein Y-linked [Synchiropus splendidus]